MWTNSKDLWPELQNTSIFTIAQENSYLANVYAGSGDRRREWYHKRDGEGEKDYAHVDKEKARERERERGGGEYTV